MQSNQVREFVADFEAVEEDQIAFGLNRQDVHSRRDSDAILYAATPITVEELLRLQAPPDGLKDAYERAHDGDDHDAVHLELEWHALASLPDRAEYFD